MTKPILVLAAVAALGFSSAAFADVAKSAVKHQLRPHARPGQLHREADSSLDRRRKYVVVHGHKVWLSRQAHVISKKHLANHVPVSKQQRTKVAS
jgi:hypothetical protein